MDLHKALAEHRFSLIMRDKMEPWLEADINRFYARDGRAVRGRRPVDSYRLSNQASLDLHSSTALMRR